MQSDVTGLSAQRSVAQVWPGTVAGARGAPRCGRVTSHSSAARSSSQLHFAYCTRVDDSVLYECTHVPSTWHVHLKRLRIHQVLFKAGAIIYSKSTFFAHVPPRHEPTPPRILDCITALRMHQRMVTDGVVGGTIGPSHGSGCKIRTCSIGT